LGIATLIESSFQHLESAEVQAGVAGALRNLSVSPSIAQLIVEKNAIQSLVQAAQAHSTNAIVQAGVAGALRNLSVNESNRKQIIACGGIAALDKAAELHAENEKLQIEVAGARRNLLGDSPAKRPGAIDTAAANANGTGGADAGAKPKPFVSPFRRPSFGRKASRTGTDAAEPAAQSTEAVQDGSTTDRSSSFGRLFGGLSRRNKSPARPARKE
jgi:hypothetical protein